MTLIVHRSHRTERLAEKLFDALANGGEGIFEVPWLVVQGRGMERWLSREGARRRKVFAGVVSLHVRSFVTRTTDTVLGPSEEKMAEAGELVFRVLRHLDDVAKSADGAPFARYLGPSPDTERRVQLAERLAALFDKYLVHRPRLLEAWERGESMFPGDADERAQAALFRAIGFVAPMHEARRVRLAIDALKEGRVTDPSKLPRRVFLFGVGTLAPLHLDLVRALATVREVHLSMLAPSDAWMSDLAAHEVERGEIGSVVRGLGKLSADFQRLLADGEQVEDDDFDGEPLTTTLATLQHDLRTFTARGEGREPCVQVAPHDRSLMVHACHSPLRELEVLRDELVARLEADPTLRPDDVAVLMIDVDRYAPFVHAVFGRDEPGRAIPYHLADRSARKRSGYFDAFFEVFESLSERLSLSSLSDLLEHEAVRAKFGIEESGVSELLEALRRAGARAGLDQDERERLGQGAFAEPTFEHALDRLVLGYATGRTDGLFEDAAPFGGAVAFDADKLGPLLEAFDALAGLRHEFAASGDAATLIAFAKKVAESWLSREGDFEDDADALDRVLDGVELHASAAGYEGPMTMESLGRLLLARLEDGMSGGDFLRGGVTFCRHVPMRAIPFRVIAMLGLDDVSFPRRTEPPSFDLTRKRSEPGDRTPRDDDRQAFLEALLSARDALWIFYVGRSIADDAKQPVSAVVALVLDVLARATTGPSGEARELVLEHALHAFDPRCFAPDSPFSPGSEAAYKAAVATLGERSAPSFELAIETPAESDGPQVVRLDEILELLDRPARAFVRGTLVASAGEDARVLDERESLEAKGLDGHALLSECLRLTEAGLAPDDVFRRVRAGGLLPPGTLGELAFERAKTFVDASFDALPSGKVHAPVAFGLDLDGIRVEGTLTGLRDDGQVMRTASRLALHKFALFVRHLALRAVAQEGGVGALPTKTIGVGRDEADGAEVFEAPACELDARAALRVLGRAVLASRSAPQLVHPVLLEAAFSAAIAAKDDWDEGAQAAAKTLATKLAASDEQHRDYTFDKPEWRMLVGPVAATDEGVRPKHLGASFVEVARDVYAPFAHALHALKEAKR